jgi:nucleotide-binding universal stress UspA family protein
MSHPFQKILCAVDLGPNSQLIIEMAHQIAQADGGSVIFFHVVPMPVEAMGQPLMVEPLTGAEEDARRQLNRLASESHTPKYEIEVVTGDPAQCIIEAAQQHDADLIVIATHGRTGLSHFVLGSVAERVVRESSIPVMTVRAPAKHSHVLSKSILLG